MIQRQKNRDQAGCLIPVAVEYRLLRPFGREDCWYRSQQDDQIQPNGACISVLYVQACHPVKGEITAAASLP